MEIIKVSYAKPDQRVIKKAARVIRRGGLVIFPTETVYGLGADAWSAAAVRKIFRVKGRPEGKPLIVHVSKKSALDVLARDIPSVARVLTQKFWPGPLTLVLKRRSFLRRARGKTSHHRLANVVTGGGETVAIRMPDHPVALALIREAGPIAAPSANFSGAKPPTRVSEIPKALLTRVDLVLDAGSTSVKVPSTVLDLTAHPPRIVRDGAISKVRLAGAGVDFF